MPTACHEVAPKFSENRMFSHTVPHNSTVAYPEDDRCASSSRTMQSKHHYISELVNVASTKRCIRAYALATLLAFIALLLLGTFLGCSSYSTSSAPIRNNRVYGLMYYLPRGVVRITGGNKSQSPAGQPVQAVQPVQPVQGGPNQQPQTYTISITPEYEPGSQQYYLKPDRNYIFLDQTHLQVNSNHLLTAGNASAEDQTKDVLTTLASIVSETGQLVAKANPLPVVRTVGDLQARMLLMIANGLDAKKSPKKEDIDIIRNALALKDDSFLQAGVTRNQEEQFYDANFTTNKNATVPFMTLLQYLGLFKADAELGQNAVQRLFADLMWPNEVPAPQAPVKGETAMTPIPFNLTFHPENQTEIDHVNALLPSGIHVDAWCEETQELATSTSIWKTNHNGTVDPEVHGIVFRPVRIYRVRVKYTPVVDPTAPGSNKQQPSEATQVVVMPDIRPGHEMVLDFSRMPFVQKVTNIGFDNGMLVSYDLTIPSPILGFLEIPKSVLQALVPLPFQSEPAGSGTKAGLAPTEPATSKAKVSK
jgi:hypothetical protein